MAYLGCHSLPQLTLNERFQVELTHFKILLQERLDRYEKSWRSHHRGIPSYVSLKDCLLILLLTLVSKVSNGNTRFLLG